jgi:ABC-type sugar transport system substrate-binding protein
MRRFFRSGVFVLLAALLVLPACSSQGGRKAEQGATDVGPQRRIAFITHAKPGDSFWDIIRKGAEMAAAKDNAKVLYSSDPEAGRQAQLVQAAIDQHVDGIVVTLAKPDAMRDVLAKAKAAGIPVVSVNAGETRSAELGALTHVGQDEKVGGQLVGQKLNELGAKHVVCVNQEQGHVGLEARCAGTKETFHGTSEVLYVNGEDPSQVRSSITAKLQTDPSIDYVLTLGAPYALNALESVSDAGSKAKVGTFDMNKDSIQAVKDGRLVFSVDQQPYLQGYLSVDQVWLYLKNGNVMGVGQRAVQTGPNIVTRENVAQVEQFANQGTR